MKNEKFGMLQMERALGYTGMYIIFSLEFDIDPISYSELANLKRDMSGSVHKMARKNNQKNYKLQTEHRGKNWWMVPKPRQGYKWTRDYDSTDEENMWDRIGSMFGANTDRSGNDSVSEGDYCIHDHRRCTV